MQNTSLSEIERSGRIYRRVIYQQELQMRHFSGSYRYLNRLRFRDKRSNSLSARPGFIPGRTLT